MQRSYACVVLVPTLERHRPDTIHSAGRRRVATGTHIIPQAPSPPTQPRAADSETLPPNSGILFVFHGAPTQAILLSDWLLALDGSLHEGRQEEGFPMAPQWKRRLTKESLILIACLIYSLVLPLILVALCALPITFLSISDSSAALLRCHVPTLPYGTSSRCRDVNRSP